MKTLLVLLLLPVTIAAAAEGPVSTWDFNGGVAETCGKSKDTLTPRAGKLRFVTARELPGVNGKAVAIGVTRSDAQSLTLAACEDVKLGASYTIEAWIHPTEIAPEWNRLVLNWGHGKSYHFAIHGGRVSLYHAQANGDERAAEGGKVAKNRWNHIVAVARRNDKTPGRSKIEVYLNGKLVGSTHYDGTIKTLKGEGLGVGDSAGTPGKGVQYRGYIDSLSMWNRAITPSEIAKRCAAGKKALALPSSHVAVMLNKIKNASPLETAVSIHKDARFGKVDDAVAEVAAKLLDDKDIFVRAMAEWAITRKVGNDNNHEEIKWTPASDAPWFKKWMAIPLADRVDMDYCRQAVELGLYNDAAKLKASVDEMIARVAKMGAKCDSLKPIRAKMDAVTDIAALRNLWLDARRKMRPVAFAHSELNFDEILVYTRFTMHYKPNVCGVHTSWSYKPGGDIQIVSGLEKHKSIKNLIKGKLGPGHVHGLDISFDAKKIVFSWANQPSWPPKYSTRWPRRGNSCYAFELRNSTIPPHLYEMDIASGKITQLTDHNFWTDVEPVYCPDGSIAFTSDRSANSPSCDGVVNDLTDHNLYSITPDRKSIRRLTNQKDVDMHPHLLDNGLIGYLRWEYQERHFWDVHSVWTVRPDGTMSDALFKQHLGAPASVRDARSVPGTSKLVAIAAGHHCLPKGPIVILNPATGLNEEEGIQLLTKGPVPQEKSQTWKKKTMWDTNVVPDGGVNDAGGHYMTPYAVSDKVYMASYGYGSKNAVRYRHYKSDVDSNGLGVYLLDTFGNKELIYRDPLHSVYSVVPFKKRKTPAVMPDATDYSKNYATCIVPDIYQGMHGVKRGDVKYIRIGEALPWPIVPGLGVKRWDLSNRWNPVRVIGTVPVEVDGSAHFKVPTVDSASVYFQALDENHMEIRRMRSNISFQPGEKRSCNGCHETQAVAVSRQRGIASRRQADMPKAPVWGARTVVGFENLIQPILDKKCVKCHSGSEAKGKIDLSKGKAYNTIVRGRKLVTLSNRQSDGGVTSVKQFGSHKSKLITNLLDKNYKGHKDLRLSKDEWITLVTWVDANAPNQHLMWSKRPADGGKSRWEAYDWGDPWAPSQQIPAMGVRLTPIKITKPATKK
ncbi:MAG: hypothetical protein HN350_07100 [Phycisphaerales bacterium]|jgi:hypothetical protein|nr:hypothetical protein [Phycisphaerales bacterium]